MIKFETFFAFFMKSIVVIKLKITLIFCFDPIRLNWKGNGDNEDDSNNKLIISSEECVEVAFAAA